MSEIEQVFDEAMHAIEELWNDARGNFILQKLLDHGTMEMKDEICIQLLSNLVSISTRVYG